MDHRRLIVIAGLVLLAGAALAPAAGAEPRIAILSTPASLAPSDPDGNGVFDDVNRNGRADFADIVLYFNQMSWIAANEPLSAFDCSDNDRIDFADVVWLFNNL